MHDELKEAIAKIQRAAKENEKSTGIYSTSGEQAREFADQGFNMVRVFDSKEAQAKLIEYASAGFCYDRCAGSLSIHDILIDSC